MGQGAQVFIAYLGTKPKEVLLLIRVTQRCQALLLRSNCRSVFLICQACSYCVGCWYITYYHICSSMLSQSSPNLHTELTFTRCSPFLLLTHPLVIRCRANLLSCPCSLCATCTNQASHNLLLSLLHPWLHVSHLATSFSLAFFLLGRFLPLFRHGPHILTSLTNIFILKIW